ncbi:LexA family protein [Pantoea stewartii]|uniref:LexA family protein n=1 Tax=Pantoea stewartii TaxID=66269 RepID=UPI00360A245A
MAISKAELGLTKNFNSNTLFKISKALNCDAQWLQTGKGDADNGKANEWDTNVSSAPQKDFKYSYPTLNWVQAGQFMTAGDDFNIYDIDNWKDSVKYAGENGFWLVVKGDSMSSPVGVTFPEGMSILINPDADVYPGCYVLAYRKSSGEATFKQYVCDAGDEYLKPINPQYSVIRIDEDCIIGGVIVDARWDIF